MISDIENSHIAAETGHTAAALTVLSMVRKAGIRSAIIRINKAGALLVFPIKGKPGVPSLWSSLYPGDRMKWDWSDEADDRVAQLWHLRTRLSDSREVVYSKWFKNRATVFSLELFTALLSLVSPRSNSALLLSADAQTLLAALNDDSPLGTGALKRLSEFEGRERNAAFERAMRELWQRFLIVGYGEVEERGYPSLAVGSARLLFEDAWKRSLSISDSERRQTLSKFFLPQSEFYAQYLKLERLLMQPGADDTRKHVSNF